MGLLQKQNAISQIGNLAGGLVGALSGNLAAGVESIYTAATGTYLLNENINAQKESHDLIPPTAKGNSSGSFVAAALFGSQVYCHVMSVTAQMAKTIDDFSQCTDMQRTKLKYLILPGGQTGILSKRLIAVCMGRVLPMISIFCRQCLTEALLSGIRTMLETMVFPIIKEVMSCIITRIG